MEDRHELFSQLAEAVRVACVQAAIDGYEQASFDGLCCEGAYESALSAMRMLNIDALVTQQIAQFSSSQRHHVDTKFG